MRIATAILSACLPVLACACSSVSFSCSNLSEDRSSVIFVGTVLSPEDPETQALVHGSPIVFKVTERLRGDIGDRIEVYEPRTSCDYSFKVGDSYLVFAYVANGHLITSQLSSTQPLLTASAVLRQLRAINKGRRPASMFGFLGQRTQLNRSQPVSGITIKATSADRTFTTRTEADGSFQFAVLPPESYLVTAELSKGFVPAAPIDARLKRGESCDLGEIRTVADGRIKGRVIDSKMMPEPGFLSIFPAAKNERTSWMGYEVGKRGRFVLSPLPPGQYRLVFRPTSSPRISFYYPEQPSAAIDLRAAQHIDNLTFIAR